MFRRVKKATSLLILVASVVSIMPVSASAPELYKN